MQRIALLGLGAMGSGMAANWVKNGFPLTIYNRTRGKARELEAAGAKYAASPREAAADADVIVSVVADDDASRGVWFGERGSPPSAVDSSNSVLMVSFTLATKPARARMRSRLRCRAACETNVTYPRSPDRTTRMRRCR